MNNDNNPLFGLVTKRQNGIFTGIPSFCSANKIVIEAILDQSKRFDDKVVIEATSNQVNQFGGYFHMTPFDFRDYVYKIAESINYDKSNIILGGDHLGPQPWQNLPEKEAMENSMELVRQTVMAGYLKIHLDTSMRVGDDDVNIPLSDDTIARRGAILMKVAEDAYQELLKNNPDAIHPVFVVGSEVPIPGGAQDEEKMKITKPSDFENTIIAYKRQFDKYDIADLWKYVIAVVVQPGVEFAEANIHKYNRLDSFKLCQKLKEYPDLVFEGHSTDFQSPEALKQMVEDGIAIIKVGPALTFAVREALFALSFMERELIEDDTKRAHFIEILEDVMLENPKDWKNYYKGTLKEQYFSRKYSYSDRCRYYFTQPRVEAAIEKLLNNMSMVDIPLGMLMQYMPMQYMKVRDGKLEKTPRELVKDSVVNIVEDYNYAVKRNYMVGSLFY
jgi:D-tagatose-1,6-bisphosphate aldolase subunit GatZ/KbaZ